MSTSCTKRGARSDGSIDTTSLIGGPVKGYVREVFSSLQGEGLYVGQKTFFIRFSGCNLNCAYCDTPEARTSEGPFLYGDRTAGNPIDIDLLCEQVEGNRVCVTGGEPLMQIDFLEALCTRLRGAGRTLHLETNGSLPDALERVAGHFNVISLDFKIPSATRQKDLWPEHERSLKIASGRDVFVKAVIDENVIPEEIVTMCTIIGRVDRTIPLVIQPVFGRRVHQILELQNAALSILDDVRVIPQVHKYLFVR